MKGIILKWASGIAIGLLLAIITQVGVVSFIASLFIIRFLKIRNLPAVLGTNILMYGMFSVLVALFFAPYFGRVPVSTNENLKFANSLFSIGLNRNYVTPELNQLLSRISTVVSEVDPNATILVLDANFPFINGYPLAPHLSHNDGRKVDLGYMYVNSEGKLIGKSAANSGYGYFEEPLPGETDTTAFCKEEGYFQYDYPKYLTFGVDDSDFIFSEKWNKLLLDAILAESEVKKVFVEQHIVDRLGLEDKRLRFQGCGSVRHDDHIHLQI